MPAQRLAPDALLVQTGLSGSVSAIQDDPDAPDASWLTATAGNNTELRASFPAPQSALQAGAGLQGVRVLVRKTGQQTAPTAVVELWESGSLVSTLVASTTVNGQTVLSGSFDASALADPSGAGVEVRVVGTVGGGSPSKRASVEVGAVEWNATTQTLTLTAHGDAEATVANPNAVIAAQRQVKAGQNLTGGTEVHAIFVDPPVAGDNLVAVVVWRDTSGTASDTLTPPAGWTAVPGAERSQIDESGAAHVRAKAFEKVAEAGESSTVSFTLSASRQAAIGLWEFYDANGHTLVQQGVHLASATGSGDSTGENAIVDTGVRASGDQYLVGAVGHRNIPGYSLFGDFTFDEDAQTTGGTNAERVRVIAAHDITSGDTSSKELLASLLTSWTWVAMVLDYGAQQGTPFTASADIEVTVHTALTATADAEASIAESVARHADVQATIGASLTAHGDAEAAVHASLTATSDAATTVTASFRATADAAAMLTAALSARGDAEASVSADYATAADAEVTIHNGVTFRGDAATTVTADYNANADADAIVSADYSGDADAEATLAQPTTGRADAEATITQTGFRVRGDAVASITADYAGSADAAATVSAAYATSADVAASIAAPFAATADVGATITATFRAKGDAAGTVTADYAASADAQVAVHGGITFHGDATASVTADYAAAADARAQVTADYAAAGDAEFTVHGGVTFRSDAELRVTAAVAVMADAAATITAPFTARSDAETGILAVYSRGADVEVRVVESLVERADLALEVTAALDARVDAAATITRSISESADAEATIGTPFALGADAEVRVSAVLLARADAEATFVAPNFVRFGDAEATLRPAYAKALTRRGPAFTRRTAGTSRRPAFTGRGDPTTSR